MIPSRIFLATLLAVVVGLHPLLACDAPGAGRKEIPLSRLEDQLRKMLDRQSTIRTATQKLDRAIQSTTDKKPRPQDKQAALKLAESQKQLIAEATKIIDRLNKEGAAVAFS